MLQSMKALKKCSILATDGEVGKVTDAYFDDERWVVRHLIVDTGNWLTRHEVLLSPLSVSGMDWEHHQVQMDLRRDTIDNSPGVDAHQPVSRQAEAALARHYGLPYYWGGPHSGDKPNFDDEQIRVIQDDIAHGNPEDRFLRSYNEVAGYAIAARDDRVGHVADVLFDDHDWSIQYLVVDPRDIWPGKHVLVPASRIESVYWTDRKVAVDMTRDEVENSPEYDPDNLPPSAGPQGRVRGSVGVNTVGRPGV